MPGEEKSTRLDLLGTWQGICKMLPLAAFTVAFGLALELWETPLPLLALAATTLAIHTRHVLMSAALHPWLCLLPRRQQFATVGLLTDSNWAMAISEYQRGERNVGILLGGGIALWTAWVMGTAIGLTFGGSITEPERFGLDVIMMCFLLVIIFNSSPRTAMYLPWAAAAASALAAYWWLPAYLHVMVGALTGGAVAALYRGGPRREGGQ